MWDCSQIYSRCYLLSFISDVFVGCRKRRNVELSFELLVVVCRTTLQTDPVSVSLSGEGQLSPVRLFAESLVHLQIVLLVSLTV